MDHLAILSKEKNFLGRILSGEKTIESRWYRNRKPPFKTIAPGDTVYFKESGEPVVAKAIVDQVIFFEDLDKRKIAGIISEYGSRIGIDGSYAANVIGKRYCTLIFIGGIQKLTPFQIDKKGYGNMAAWITVESIDQIRLRK
jgi:ASC-1-like (ASCH) protein